VNNIANVLSILIALVLIGSAVGDFKMAPAIVESMKRLKVPVERMNLLGAIKIAATLGLIAGFKSHGLTALTAVCLCMYFAIAVATHVRVKDAFKEIVPAFVLTVLSVVLALAAFAR
jgi:hypothetical protein